jgi:hypothetical protein
MKETARLDPEIAGPFLPVHQYVSCFLRSLHEPAMPRSEPGIRDRRG